MEVTVQQVTQKMNPIIFQTTDWSSIPRGEYSGETGKAIWRIVEYDNLRIRMVEYSAGYTADHGWAKGHIVFCVDGDMIAELKDGSIMKLSKGMTFQMSAHAGIRRAVSEQGATLLIIDGDVLKERKQRHFNPWKM